MTRNTLLLTDHTPAKHPRSRSAVMVDGSVSLTEIEGSHNSFKAPKPIGESPEAVLLEKNQRILDWMGRLIPG